MDYSVSLTVVNSADKAITWRYWKRPLPEGGVTTVGRD